jgi:hypothetical protein
MCRVAMSVSVTIWALLHSFVSPPFFHVILDLFFLFQIFVCI